MSAVTTPRPTFAVSDVACRDHEHEDACRYQVAWSINPHMAIGSVEYARAAEQHDAYVRALQGAGADVIRLPFVHGAYDSVFAKDSALLLSRGGVTRALLASPRHPERRREQLARAEAYSRHGFDVVTGDPELLWEGGDVVMLPSGQGMFLGHGPRSRLQAAAWLERHAGIPVCPLELRDPHLYHLDMALAVLPDGCALVCESALTDASMETLARTRGIRHVAIVRRADALHFGLNLVAIGTTILCGVRTPSVAAIAASRGYTLVTHALDQFHLAGGSAGCLVARVHPDPQPVTERAVPAQRRRDVYGPLFRSVLQPVWESKVRRRPVLSRLAELQRSQWASPERLREMQIIALRRLVEHAYDHVPFYRERFAANGLTASDITTPEDLLALPILRRAELRGRTDRVSTAPPFATIRKETSGTTGEPLLFGYEPDSEHWRRAIKLRGYEWAGYRAGDRALHFWGARMPEQPSWKTRMKIALDRRLHRDLYVPCDVMSDDHLRETVELIARARPRVLVCYAQAGAELARFINRSGLRSWETMPVICGAERLDPKDRADLEAAFGPSVFDTYGCREVMLIGAECEAHAGLHLSMENLIVEIVVTEDGRQRHARPGESGEVVLTDLHNLAMPFLRYANGDIATAADAGPCTCGRTLPRIQSVQGRASETIRDANGSAVSGIAISFLFRDLAGSVRQFQAIQHVDHTVSINLVPSEVLSPLMIERIRTDGRKLLSGLDVHVNVVDDLPRTPAGKHRLVIVER